MLTPGEPPEALETVLIFDRFETVGSFAPIRVIACWLEGDGPDGS